MAFRSRYNRQPASDDKPTSETLGYLNFYYPYTDAEGVAKRGKIGIRGLELIGSETANGQEMTEMAEGLNSGAISAVDLFRQILVAHTDDNQLVQWVPKRAADEKSEKRVSTLNYGARKEAAA